VNVFAPVKRSVPAPRLINDPLPEITPPNTVLVPSPTVSTFDDNCNDPPVAPPPANDPNVSEASNRNVAPATFASVTATVSAKAAPPDSATVPAFTLNPPVNVFAPLNVNTPAPCFTTCPAPCTTAAKLTLDASPKVNV
jgi:hypothetical protein